MQRIIIMQFHQVVTDACAEHCLVASNLNSSAIISREQKVKKARKVARKIAETLRRWKNYELRELRF